MCLVCCRYRLYGVLLREPTDFHDVNEPGQDQGGTAQHSTAQHGIPQQSCSSATSWTMLHLSDDCMTTLFSQSAWAANGCSSMARYRCYRAAEPCMLCLSCTVGQLISRLTSDCYSITRCIATNVNVALRNLLQVIGKPHACNSSSSRSCRLCPCASCTTSSSRQLAAACATYRCLQVCVLTGCQYCHCRRRRCHFGSAVSWVVRTLPGNLHNTVGLHHHLWQLQQTQPEGRTGAQQAQASKSGSSLSLCHSFMA